ncbi:DUF1704 domain-containing protein [Candidatus Saccharibacteria bacterium]|nr:DUF1704 domain-containing protein [Candidatus Saccharibacteria bacterium]
MENTHDIPDTQTPSEEVFYEPNDSSLSLEQALNFAPKYFDYSGFSGDTKQRNIEKEAFTDGRQYLPQYEYPALVNHLTGGAEELSGDPELGHQDQVRLLTNLQAVIEQHRVELGDEVADLYIGMYDTLIGRELLMHAAYKSLTAGSAESRQTWRNKFKEINEALYGPIDVELFESIISTERRRLEGFEPISEDDVEVKTYLENFYASTNITEREEYEPIDQELIDVYMPLIEEKYGHIFDAIPDTEDDVEYDANGVAEVINSTLEAGGLYQKGWRCVVSSSRSSVSTNTAKQLIEIPSHDKRNAKQIKALVIHEQEVHARRGQNGLESRYPGLLANGTANYADSEEGLAIALECIVNGSADDNPAIRRARDRYINVGLAAGIGSTSGRDARQVFEIAWRIEAVKIAKSLGKSIDKEIIKMAQSGQWGAYAHLENMFRGTSFAGQNDNYTKLKVYLEGVVKSAQILKLIKADPERFDKLFIGKYDHTDSRESALVNSIVG